MIRKSSLVHKQFKIGVILYVKNDYAQIEAIFWLGCWLGNSVKITSAHECNANTHVIDIEYRSIVLILDFSFGNNSIAILI